MLQVGSHQRAYDGTTMQTHAEDALAKPFPDGETVAEMTKRALPILARHIGMKYRSKISEESRLQSAFKSMWRRWSEFERRSDQELFRFLLKIALNKLLEKIRNLETQKRDIGREISADETSAEEGIPIVAYLSVDSKSPEDVAILNEVIDRVRDTIRASKPEHRDVLLRHYEGHTRNEIAEDLNISAGQVGHRLRQGLQQLKTLLKQIETDFNE